MQNSKQGYEAVVQLLRDYPEWYPIVAAALEEAQTIKSDRFAGAWILERARKHGVQWIPNFRKLVSYGILQKEGESSRGGRRAYYSMPDAEGVARALEEFNSMPRSVPYTGHKVTDAGIAKLEMVTVPYFANLASCGSFDAIEPHVDEYREVNTELAKPGHQYFLVRANGDSMNQAGINSRDVLLVRVQNYANPGDRVVARRGNEVTIKEFHPQGNTVLLLPRSDNPVHKPLLANNVEIQGVVVATIPGTE